MDKLHTVLEKPVLHLQPVPSFTPCDIANSKGDADQKTELHNTVLKNTCSETEMKCNIIEIEKEKMPRSFIEKSSPGNLDLFEDMYESWRAKEENLEFESKGLNQRIESYEELQKTSNVKITDLSKTIELLQTSINALHNELNMLEKFGKENVDLKSKLKSSEQVIKSLQVGLEEKEKECNCKVAHVEEKYKVAMKKLETENKTEIVELKSKHDTIVIQKEEEISELKLRIEDVEKEKQSELVRMSVEYDNKLAKLQRQRAAASLNQQQPSSNQEIFRKKLQHLKSEYDKEINSLKEQITSLKSQLPAAESPHRSRSLFTMGPLAKKMRK